MRALLIAVSGAVLAATACSPSSPSRCVDRSGRDLTFNHMEFACNFVGPTMQCQATASTSGAVDCSIPPRDVTTLARWSVLDSSIVKSDGGGLFEAVRPGDTLITGVWSTAEGTKTISVFQDATSATNRLSIYPTRAISGVVTDASTGSLLNDATVTVKNGLIAGRVERSGAADPVIAPGFLYLAAAGRYQFSGVPPDIYQLSVTKDGFVPAVVTATVSYYSGAVADVALVPAPSR